MAPRPVSDAEIITRSYLQMDTNVEIDKRTGCWLWTGKLWDNGYGRLARITRWIPGVVHGRVHIASWLRYRGKVPKGRMICHSCFVKRCFNPEHLYAGTNRQNQMDAVNAGVFARYWTKARRKAMSAKQSGTLNPMYGRRGKLAPAYGRTGDKHPMFGKHHSEESRRKTSRSLLKFNARKEHNDQDR